MKKVFLFLMAAMLFAHIGANAAGQLYLCGDAPFGNGWGNDQEHQVAMATDDDGATYTATVEFLSGTRYFCVTDGYVTNNDWAYFNANNRYGCSNLTAESGNYQLTKSNEASMSLPAGKYTISINSNTMVMTLTVIHDDEEELAVYTPTIASNSEQSVFLETDSRLTPYVWPYYGERGGEYYLNNMEWPGQQMTLMGKTSEGKFIYKWICGRPETIGNIIFNDNSTKQDFTFTNHGYYTLSGDNFENIEYSHEVTALSAITSAPKDAVIYEMNVGAFTAEGTFTAAKARLSELKNLGVDIVWLMPIFERNAAYNASPYSVKDYKTLNSKYGTLADLNAFINEAHNQGIKVIIDWVANHTATNATWITSDPGLYAKDGENFINPNGWGDVYQLNMSSNETQTAMINAMKYWVKNTAIDGFRCDMVEGFANWLPATFWSRAINELKNSRQGLIFLAETDLTKEHDKAVELRYVGFDYDYTWRLQEEAMAKEIANGTDVEKIKSFNNDLKSPSGHVAYSTRMVYTTNHDVNGNDGEGYGSQSTLYGDNENPLTVVTFTIPGVPLIYNGQENGYLTNHTLNYFNDSKIDWSTSNPSLTNTIKTLASLRKSNYALDSDAPIIVKEVTQTAANKGVIAYTREKDDKQVLVVMNLGTEDANDFFVQDIPTATWSKVIDSETIAETTDPTNVDLSTETSLTVKAHGYQVYELTNYYDLSDAGWYLNCQDDQTGLSHKMSLTSSVDGKNTYTIAFSAEKFNEMSNNEGTLKFNFREYYVNEGKVVRNPNPVTPKDNDYEFTTDGQSTNNIQWQAGTSFTLKPIDGAKQYKFTLEYQYANAPVITLNVVTDYSAGYYLNCQADENGQSFPMQLLAEGEDEDGYTHHITITAADFDTYSAHDANKRLFFKLREYNADENGNVTPNPMFITTLDKDANGFIFKDDKVNDKYEQAAWTNDGSHYFIIEKTTGYASYDIRFKKTSTATFVKVVFTRDYTWEGHSLGEEELVSKGVNFNNALTPEDLNGKWLYLYNVDTGRFLYNKGTWGTEAMASYTEFGMKLKLVDTSSAQTKAGGNYGEGNYAIFTGSSQTSYNQGAFLGYDQGLDLGQNQFLNTDRGGDGSGVNVRDESGAFRWHFDAISSGSTASTYLLSVDLYSEKGGSGNLTRYYVNVVEDAANNSFKLMYSTTEKPETTDEAKAGNYRWQIVTYDDLVAAFTNENADAFGGMEADATFMFQNPDFARGLQDGIKTTSNTQSWLDNGGIYKYYGENSAANGKNWVANLEGTGSLSQGFTPPAAGIYRVDLNGVVGGGNAANISVKVPYIDNPYTTNIRVLTTDEYREYLTNYYKDNEGNKGLMRLCHKFSEDMEDRTQYLNTVFFYVPENAVNQTVTVSINQTEYNQNGGYTAIDNFRCTYLGEAPFILNRVADNTDYIANENRTKVPVYLNRQFTPGGWHAIFLPVNVTVAQMKQAFGNYVEVSEANGLDPDDPYRILFESVSMKDNTKDAILAGHYYLVKPELSRSTPSLVKRAETRLNPVSDGQGYVSLGMHDMSSISVSSERQYSEFYAPGEKFTDHNGIRYVGRYIKEPEVPARSYVFANRKTDEGVETALFHITNKMELDAFRFWIVDLDNASAETSAKPFTYYITSTGEELVDNGDGTLTPVESIWQQNIAEQHYPSGTYTLSGLRVSDESNLPKGIYIRNGKKIMVK